ncbi:DUF2607 family protein [Rhizobium sp. 007]|uniref:DUF2607 family protein n=1 Tax=Rhizobium sp. 007 TaxID=2785056 RepID=UPI0018903F92|nr:DUF2607 family protein [Rhizobium sp. 007]QPB21149.1 DUF2607 family protein [Rhizobium sp. 007]
MVRRRLTKGPKAASVQQIDRSWSVLDKETGLPVEASGCKLTGLSREEADDIAARLNAAYIDHISDTNPEHHESHGVEDGS